jgi:transposase
MTHLFYLSEPMQKDLEKVARASTSFIRQVFRTRIILLAAEGKSRSFICQELRTTPTTVRKWINRFNRYPSLETLEDAPRSGRPHTVPSEAKCEVIKFACSDIRTQAPDAGNTWTAKSLQACVRRSTGIEMSKSEISRILNHEDLRPHKVKMWLHSPDPFFKEKVNKISSLYLNPPREAVILCIDEKTGMQAIERRRSVSPRNKGSMVRLDSEYKRHGTQTLIASFEVKTG